LIFQLKYAMSTTTQAYHRGISGSRLQAEETAHLFSKHLSGNPLADVISDELYHLLSSNHLIDRKALRDFIIRKVYNAFQYELNLTSEDAIKSLQACYPYLALDTLRKVVHNVFRKT